MMLTGRINHVDMLTGELCPPTSKYLEGDHVYRAASLHLHADRVRCETAEISSVRYDSLTFDGTQFVMTDYCPRSGDCVEAEIKRDDTTGKCFVFGARPAGASVQSCVYLACAYNCTYAAFGADESVIADTLSPEAEHVVSISWDGYYLDGELKKPLPSTAFSSFETMCIGGLNENGEIDSHLFSGEIFAVRVYRGNRLVHEYIPVTEGGVPGMCDMQTGSFFPRQSVTGASAVSSGIPPVEISPRGQYLEDCIIYGGSAGVGDPDPVTGKYIIPVTVRGRNLFDALSADILALYPDTNGTATVSGTSASTKQRSFCMRVEPNTQYTVSVGFTGRVTARVAGYSSYPQAGDSCEFVDRDLVSLSPMVNSFITTANTRYILCYFSYGRDTTELGEVLGTVQLEKGAQATAWVPYIISRTELSLDSPLYSGEWVSSGLLSQDIEICSGYSSISVSTQAQPERITVKYQV